MAKFSSICFAILSILLLLVQSTVSADPPVDSHTLPPESAADSPPPLSPTPISSPPDASPTNAPAISPPVPPPADLAPGSSQAPSSTPTPSPSPSSSPAPSELSDVNRSNVNKGGESEKGGEKSGMNGGQKFGVAIGVIAAVALVGFGGLVYKKRKDNIRRSSYGYAARREFL